MADYRLGNPLWRLTLRRLILTVWIAVSCNSAVSGSELATGSVSEAMRKARIAVVQFLPLPYNMPISPHERVFTGEFYSENPGDSGAAGWFIPENYLEMINTNLLAARDLYGLRLDIVKNIAEVPADANLIVLGAVRSFRAGSDASVALTIRLLRGGTHKPIRSLTIENSVSGQDVPYRRNFPIHTVGDHAYDFHPQRVLLNSATHKCVLDLLNALEKEAGRP